MASRHDQRRGLVVNEGFASSMVRVTGYNPFAQDIDAEAKRIREIANNAYHHALDQGLVIVTGPSGVGKTLILDGVGDATSIHPRDLGFGQTWPRTHFDYLPTQGILVIDDAQWMGRDNFADLLRTLLEQPRSTVMALPKLSRPMRTWILESRERRRLPTLIVSVFPSYRDRDENGLR